MAESAPVYFLQIVDFFNVCCAFSANLLLRQSDFTAFVSVCFIWALVWPDEEDANS